MNKNVLAIILAPILLSCATTAGPFVTNISHDGDGNIIVEKCMTRYDPWMATVSNSDCSHVAIRINRSYKDQSRYRQEPGQNGALSAANISH